MALKINYEFGWFFLYLYARRIWPRITINDKFCERWKLILATTKINIFYKERMTKNWWFFINNINNEYIRNGFCKFRCRFHCFLWRHCKTLPRIDIVIIFVNLITPRMSFYFNAAISLITFMYRTHYDILIKWLMQ